MKASITYTSTQDLSKNWQILTVFLSLLWKSTFGIGISLYVSSSFSLLLFKSTFVSHLGLSRFGLNSLCYICLKLSNHTYFENMIFKVYSANNWRKVIALNNNNFEIVRQKQKLLQMTCHRFGENVRCNKNTVNVLMVWTIF